MHIKSNGKVLVIGIGKSGKAAVCFLSSRGFKVDVCDNQSTLKVRETINKISHTIEKAFIGDYPDIERECYDYIVISPGVPLDIEPVVQAGEMGIKVISELELAFLNINAPIAAITGTNGKTTTAALTKEIVAQSGREGHLGGNIGIPLLSLVENVERDHIVIAEVSSFQLETTCKFAPEVAAVLNLSPDHLDRHVSYENYVAAKAKIFSNQKVGGVTILNYDDPDTKKLSQLCPQQVIFFSRQHTLDQGVYIKDNQIVSRYNGIDTVVCKTDEVYIKGEHNLENALAATAIATVLGIKGSAINKALRFFRGVEHRLEFVDEVNGVEYINDSKGTNPNAAEKAVKAYEKPIVLILGGKDKGSDFYPFMKSIASRLKGLIILGETADKIHEAANKVGFKEVYKVKDYYEAVETAKNISVPGDVVMLSPACASWDMFNSFEERGELFKKLVTQLRG